MGLVDIEFDWTESLKLIETLSKNYLKEDSIHLEAFVRMLVNRSYYASFHKISKHLKDNNIYKYDKNNATKSSHDDLISELRDISEKTYHPKYIQNQISRKRYKKIMNLIKRLKKNRKRVDYDDSKLEETIEIANDSIKLAQDIFQRIKWIETNEPYNHEIES
jgi:uncharacterized protein (UPF0332 family)